jgi:hypothetical protein
MELIMSTLTYREVDNFLFNDIKQQQFLSDQPHELNEYDMDLVSGGLSMGEAIRLAILAILAHSKH